MAYRSHVRKAYGTHVASLTIFDEFEQAATPPKGRCLPGLDYLLASGPGGVQTIRKMYTGTTNAALTATRSVSWGIMNYFVKACGV